jgi:hypothetical protein
LLIRLKIISYRRRYNNIFQNFENCLRFLSII